MSEEAPRSGMKRNTLRLETFLPYRLNVAASRVTQLISAVYEERFGITIGQWRILAGLGADGPMAQIQFVRRSSMDKIMVSRAASALLDRSLIASRGSEADRRMRVLELTPAGRTLYREIASLAIELEQDLIARSGIGDAAAMRDQLLHLEQAAQMLTRLAKHKAP